MTRTPGILSVENASKHFGGVRAVDDLSFVVPPATICALIGPNGSGKTTTLNLITGVLPLTSGQVKFGDEVISGLPRPKIVAKGISRTFQNLRLFNSLTVLEHVELARYMHCRASLMESVFGLPRFSHDKKECSDVAHHLIDMVGLKGFEEVRPSTLPYGKRRLLEIARALATDAPFICLDEPAAGMAESEIGNLIDLIRRLKNDGMSVLLIEHRMRLVMTVSEKVVVLNYGKKIAEGPPEEVASDPAVITAYLGTRQSEIISEMSQKGE